MFLQKRMNLPDWSFLKRRAVSRIETGDADKEGRIRKRRGWKGG